MLLPVCKNCTCVQSCCFTLFVSLLGDAHCRASTAVASYVGARAVAQWTKVTWLVSSISTLLHCCISTYHMSLFTSSSPPCIPFLPSLSSVPPLHSHALICTVLSHIFLFPPPHVRIVSAQGHVPEWPVCAVSSTPQDNGQWWDHRGSPG